MSFTTSCVRCKNDVQQMDHPMAHFKSICDQCNIADPENIYDQSISAYEYPYRNQSTESLVFSK